MSEKQAFWTSIQTIASTFREEDPKLMGRLRELVTHFEALSEEQQIELRHDVQLLSVQFSKLALAMTNTMDAVGPVALSLNPPA
jgi:hypothetical protein